MPPCSHWLTMKYFWQGLFVYAKPGSVTVQVPIQPLHSIFLFFIPYLGQLKLCKSPHPGVKNFPLEHRHLPHAYTEIPDLFLSFSPVSQRSSEILIFCTTKAIQHFLEAFIAQIYIEEYNYPSANAHLVLRHLSLLSITCYHSLHILGINASPFQNAHTQKGNTVFWLTLPLFFIIFLTTQGTGQKKFS